MSWQVILPAMHRLPDVAGNDEMVKVMKDLFEFHFTSKLPYLSEKDLQYMESLARVRTLFSFFFWGILSFCFFFPAPTVTNRWQHL
jgi:hypothetical protein